MRPAGPPAARPGPRRRQAAARASPERAPVCQAGSGPPATPAVIVATKVHPWGPWHVGWIRSGHVYGDTAGDEATGPGNEAGLMDLLFASQNGETNRVRELLQLNADVNFQNSQEVFNIGFRSSFLHCQTQGIL